MANDPKYQASLAMWREKARILEASAWVDQNDPPPDNGGFSIARMIRGGGP
jgi:hypothetical protein